MNYYNKLFRSSVTGNIVSGTVLFDIDAMFGDGTFEKVFVNGNLLKEIHPTVEEVWNETHKKTLCIIYYRNLTNCTYSEAFDAMKKIISE